MTKTVFYLVSRGLTARKRPPTSAHQLFARQQNLSFFAKLRIFSFFFFFVVVVVAKFQHQVALLVRRNPTEKNSTRLTVSHLIRPHLWTVSNWPRVTGSSKLWKIWFWKILRKKCEN